MKHKLKSQNKRRQIDFYLKGLNKTMIKVPATWLDSIAEFGVVSFDEIASLRHFEAWNYCGKPRLKNL